MFKKILYIFSIILIVSIQFLPSITPIAMAGSIEDELNRSNSDIIVDPSQTIEEMRDNPYAEQHVATFNNKMEVFEYVIYWILGIVGVIAILFLIIGGYYYVTSRGEESGTEKGKKIIINAIIGLVIVIASYTIVATVLTFGKIQEANRPYYSPMDDGGGGGSGDDSGGTSTSYLQTYFNNSYKV